jgi:dTDP-4-dehydrorhamnose 3,5-epimerase
MKLSDIFFTQLPRIDTLGGNVMHAMKNTDSGFAGFGEAYFSWVNSGSIKAWKQHTKMTMNLIVPIGSVRFVFFVINASGDKEFRIETVGDDNYSRLTIPPGIWFGFQGLNGSPSLVLNLASIPHDPNEVLRLGLSDVDFKWS